MVGLVLALIHAGLVALVGLQSGSFALTELPYLKDGVDMAMRSGYLTFANARFAAYLVAVVLATLIIVVAGYILRWMVVNIVGFGAPKRTAS